MVVLLVQIHQQCMDWLQIVIGVIGDVEDEFNAFCLAFVPISASARNRLEQIILEFAVEVRDAVFFLDLVLCFFAELW